MKNRATIPNEQSKGGRPALATHDAVLKAIHTLKAQDKQISVRNVMRISGGSPNTISDVLNSLPAEDKVSTPKLTLKDGVAKALDDAWKSSIEAMEKENQRKLDELNDKLIIANAINLEHDREQLRLEKEAAEKRRQFDELTGQHQREKEAHQITRSALDDAKRRLGVSEESSTRDKADLEASRDIQKKLERQLELTNGELQNTKDSLHAADLELATTKLHLDYAKAKDRVVGNTEGNNGSVDQHA